MVTTSKATLICKIQKKKKKKIQKKKAEQYELVIFYTVEVKSY